MGIFDRLFGRTPPAAPITPAILRERLFDAVQSGDSSSLHRLCTEHEAAILGHFPEWRTVPEELRRDPAVIQRYGQGLIGVARYFAESRNRPELLQHLMGPPAGNPIVRWQEAVRQADALMDTFDFDGALALLTPEAVRVRGLSGGSAVSMQAMTLGKMATCLAQSGRAEAALPLYRQALELCRAAHDEEGILAYLGSLFEVFRWLGQGAEAADAAAEYATALERSGQGAQARRFRKISGIVRRGEPLNRIVVEFDGTILELDELPPRVEGKFRLTFCRNRRGLPRAMALVERGHVLVSEGRFEEALSVFREATRIDPYAPEPVYDEALTLLYLQRASEAAICYEKVEALAPGWYHCRADRWLAAGIASGRIPHSAFVLLRRFEHSSLPAAEKERLARQGIREAPGVPVFQLLLGQELAKLGRGDEARQVFAEGLAQAQEPDIRSRLLVEFARRDTPSPERDQKLREAMAPGGNLVAAAAAMVMLRMAPGGGTPN